MTRVLTAVVLIPIVLLILFRAPYWFFTFTITAVAMISTREYLNIVEAHGIVPFRRLTLIGILAMFLAVGVDAVLGSLGTRSSSVYLWLIAKSLQLVPVFLICLPFLFLLLGMKRSDLRSVLPGASASTFAFVYPCFPLLLILFVRYRHFGESILLYLLLTVWAGDIAAYYAGRSLGRRPLAPRISPKKSWEGAVASFVASGAVGFLVLKYLPIIHSWLFSAGLLADRFAHSRFEQWAFPVWASVSLSLGINAAAQLGDLVESMLKRGAGLKDSGTLLPGHGGMLDRIDALLFAAPVLWAYYEFRLIPF
jgi:phosphatidate cytidylyltransferase